MAALAGMAHTNPSQIQDMIEDHGNGTYTVTFAGLGFISDATQTVTARFATSGHADVASRGALWPLIIEKAYAAEKGGMDVLDRGGNAGTAVDDMTNTSASSFDPREKTVAYIVRMLVAGKGRNAVMTALTPSSDEATDAKREMADNISGLHFWHWYTITDVDEAGERVKLFNPWGRSHPNGDGWLDVSDFRQFYKSVAING